MFLMKKKVCLEFTFKASSLADLLYTNECIQHIFTEEKNLAKGPNMTLFQLKRNDFYRQCLTVSNYL